MLERVVNVRRFAAVVLLSAALLPSSTHAQDDADLAALRRQVLARFDVVPLRDGVALVGRGPDRRVEIVDGLVLTGGRRSPGPNCAPGSAPMPAWRCV